DDRSRRSIFDVRRSTRELFRARSACSISSTCSDRDRREQESALHTTILLFAVLLDQTTETRRGLLDVLLRRATKLPIGALRDAAVTLGGLRVRDGEE